MITSSLIVRVLIGAALIAALVSMLMIWMLLQDPVSVARVLQREGMIGLAGLLAHDLWRRVASR
jgi:hypothetical protein